MSTACSGVLPIRDRVEHELFNATVFADVLPVVVERLTRDAPERGALTAERERIDRELGNLALAVALGRSLTAGSAPRDLVHKVGVKLGLLSGRRATTRRRPLLTVLG